MQRMHGWHERVVIWVCLVVLAVPSPRALGQAWLIHKVKRGQNLTVIAHEHGVTVQELRDWNKLRSDELAIGQQLRIPRRDSELYVVKLGDTLTAIAEKHDISVAMLRQLNGISGSDPRRVEMPPLIIPLPMLELRHKEDGRWVGLGGGTPRNYEDIQVLPHKSFKSIASS